jgi:formylglycine-generating enzyme required for sulfatase activity
VAIGSAVFIAGGCVVRQDTGPAAAPAAPDRPVVVTKGGVELIALTGGPFEMGSDDERDPDAPRHRVIVSPFYIDRCEVAQGEYERLMGVNPSRWKDLQRPVEQIRWTQAAEYCNARSREEGLQPAYDPQTWRCDFSANGYRLPTEAEWEYAVRAGSRTAHYFGDQPAVLSEYAWCKDNATQGTHPVAEKKPNAWGLCDMYGNVWEWCHDFYQEDYYGGSPDQDPTGPAEGETRVVRGGCWNSRPDQCRSAYRNFEYPEFTDVCFGKDVHGQVGFRCVRRP